MGDNTLQGILFKIIWASLAGLMVLALVSFWVKPSWDLPVTQSIDALKTAFVAAVSAMVGMAIPKDKNGNSV